VELYFYSLYTPSWLVKGQLYLHLYHDLILSHEYSFHARAGFFFYKIHSNIGFACRPVSSAMSLPFTFSLQNFAGISRLYHMYNNPIYTVIHFLEHPNNKPIRSNKQTYYRCITANRFANELIPKRRLRTVTDKWRQSLSFYEAAINRTCVITMQPILNIGLYIYTHDSQSTNMKCITVPRIVAVRVTFNSGAYSMCDRPTVESSNLTNVTPMLYNKVRSHDPL
jgi:hypothetical protein